MRQDIANRLAAGGAWAITVAWMCVQVNEHLKEHDVHIPIGGGTGQPFEVFTVCGLGAFQHYCNGFMQGVVSLNVKVNIRQQEKP